MCFLFGVSVLGDPEPSGWLGWERKVRGWLRKTIILYIFVSGPTTYYSLNKDLTQRLRLVDLASGSYAPVRHLIKEGVLAEVGKDQKGRVSRRFIDLSPDFIKVLSDELGLTPQTINEVREALRKARVKLTPTIKRELVTTYLDQLPLIDIIIVIIFITSLIAARTKPELKGVAGKAASHHFFSKLSKELIPIVNALVTTAGAKGVSGVKRRVNLGQKKERKHGIELGS